MDVAEVPALLQNLLDRTPIVRGFRVASMFVDIDRSGDGTIEAWFDPPKHVTPKQFVEVVMKDMPMKAWWRYETIDRLIACLNGQLIPEWRFDDE